MYNILVVDDSKIVRSVIVKTIGLCHLPIGRIFEAEHGLAALEVLKGNWVDMIFTDINMPVMNGVEFVQELKTGGLLSTIPVVVISTEGSEVRINALKEAGIRDFLRKPFTPEQLRETIKTQLGENHVSSSL